MTFESFFQTATGNSPYDYQCRLACGEGASTAKSETLVVGSDCQSQLINIPTGLGKTAAVVLAWLWNRVAHPNSAHRDKWPRRLVYCLPMRTLVEQTEAEVQKWSQTLLKNSAELGIGEQTLEDLKWMAENSPVILMGGEDAEEWDIYPEKPTILIGTQDMLLSRALNRGYGMSRYRWPMHFGLLNNDCLWVMDETQLMGVGFETSAQLDGFRHIGKTPTFGECPTWWMSATLDEVRLATVDHSKPIAGWLSEKLSAAEQSCGRPRELLTAQKQLSPAPFSLNTTTKGNYAKQLAALVKDRHQTDTLTLVVVNRVSRAREVFEALTDGKNPLYAREKVALIHSRFRLVDRERHTRLLFGNGDRIVIATQAVEAGVDVSARLLVTELAPWSSLVQRMGRCNRRADIGDAQVLWVDIQPKDEKDDLVRPYSTTELGKARAAVEQLTSASPQILRDVVVPPESVVRPVIRRRDLADLFDTTPDICGQDLNVSRYIRDGDDNDVECFWRNTMGDAPLRNEKPPQRIELCRVSIGDAVKFFERKTTHTWRWNPLEKKWENAEKPRPGGVYLLAMTSGGYDDDLGWTGDPKSQPTPLPPDVGNPDSHDGEPDTFSGSWQTIAEHTQLVVERTTALAAALVGNTTFAPVLRTAAQWHDIGKAHCEFQKMLRNDDDARGSQLWAKSENKNGKCARQGFRHELASSLAWLLKGPADSVERDLVAYLIAAHHGKVRLSIRSLPNEIGNPMDPDALFARGIWQGDRLPSVALGEFGTPEITLDLSFMKMGEGPHGLSWLARTVALRDRLGSFRLAFLETLLRSADARASKLEKMHVSDNLSPDDLAGQHPALAVAPGGTQAPDSVGGDPARRSREHGVREGTSCSGEDSRDTRPDRATRYIETAQGVLSYSELAPLLANRVTAVEASIFKGELSSVILDEGFLLELHRRIAGDLVPEWAGRWRDIAVTAGTLEPPPPYQVPILMRGYALDLQARWPAAAVGAPDLLIELLAFAEGRFLTIHPFRDFNGRTIRVFLLELLRRLDLPRVLLAPQTLADRSEYIAALEAADHLDWHPLVVIWQKRLINAPSR